MLLSPHQQLLQSSLPLADFLILNRHGQHNSHAGDNPSIFIYNLSLNVLIGTVVSDPTKTIALFPKTENHHARRINIRPVL